MIFFVKILGFVKVFFFEIFIKVFFPKLVKRSLLPGGCLTFDVFNDFVYVSVYFF